jgi:hypothetical protein
MSTELRILQILRRSKRSKTCRPGRNDRLFKADGSPGDKNFAGEELGTKK